MAKSAIDPTAVRRYLVAQLDRALQDVVEARAALAELDRRYSVGKEPVTRIVSQRCTKTPDTH